jgi:PTH1 family peptidyl-tRNA hydrolase
MKSAIAHLGTQNFPRLRIGIGRSNGDREAISHVLGKFSPAETQMMPDVLRLVIDAVELSMRQGVEKAMSLYNSRSVANKNQE